MRPLQFLLFDFMKSSFKMQWFLYLGLNTKFKLKGKMLCKGFEDKCLLSEVFDIMKDYKKLLILILGIKWNGSWLQVQTRE